MLSTSSDRSHEQWCKDSVPHDGRYTAVHESITQSGEVGFQNSMGVNCNHFTVLLEFYLQSTAVVFNEQFYVQKSGICIGSSVAPVLYGVYLSAMDKRISGALDGMYVVKGAMQRFLYFAQIPLRTDPLTLMTCEIPVRFSPHAIKVAEKNKEKRAEFTPSTRSQYKRPRDLEPIICRQC